MTDLPLAGAAPDVLDPAGPDDPDDTGTMAVFRNRPFLLLWLSQAFTQIGGNMVIYGLTVIILEATRSNTAVSLLILTFLGPAVLFSAVAGVYVDRIDKRHVLVVTNLLRSAAFVALFLVGGNLPAILILNIVVSTITVFFGPAEAAMIPQLVPRRQLLAANGIFTLTLNAAFAIGFALLGPIVVTLMGAPALIVVVAACYLIAAGFCWTLPAAPPAKHAEGLGHEAEEAVGSVVEQLREGVGFIRKTPKIKWSLLYLGIAASLVGVLGVIGPNFARDALGLEPKDFVVIVLPLGFGIVMGILVLNNYGQLFPRRRLIEGGLVALGILLAMLAGAGPIARALQRAETATGLGSLADFTSLVAIVVLIALLAGVAYAFVAIPAQTQLQEEIPEDVRGRVFGVLNMLVSIASFAPIIIVGPVSDLLGNTSVLFLVAIAVLVSGILSILRRGRLRPEETKEMAKGPPRPAGLDPIAVSLATDLEVGHRRVAKGQVVAPPPAEPASATTDTPRDPS
ncbi:MAG TPA: MFS transporter [Candidatus Limnocylindrales bacterium]|nr:MFS transporter [Candidatus Limnocylindrales bacterium]